MWLPLQLQRDRRDKFQHSEKKEADESKPVNWEVGDLPDSQRLQSPERTSLTANSTPLILSNPRERQQSSVESPRTEGVLILEYYRAGFSVTKSQR